MTIFNEFRKFDFAESGMNDEQKVFVSALKLLTEGKEDLSMDCLKKLYMESNDPSLQSSCAKILFELYFINSEWKELEVLGLLEDESIDKSNRIIAKALRQFEQATFSFTNDKICIPMKRSISGSPTIDVMINGRKKCFWLDTGAGMTVISDSIVKECGMALIENEDLEVGNSTNQNFNSDLAMIDTIVIDNLTILNQSTLVLASDLLKIPIPHSAKVMEIDGIIGWDIIQYLHLEIDYGKEKVMIQKHRQKDGEKNNLFFCGYPIIKVKGKNQVPLYFGLDTGANKSHFGKTLLSKIDELKIDKTIKYSGGLGDVKEREIDTIETLPVYLDENQSITLKNVRETLTDLATFFKLDGVFGMDIAHNGSLVIDYPNRQLELKY
ncbi:aspartyl protease family protein [Niallia circulans]|uniref:aspartyl protease family protein n=1 Tax=Niallia circulans TaxID=1397 RepID=UPI001560E4E9|nr:aspartyl protease family protein [Niallia circulans]NRG34331.1 retropepsin-like domain-containing protein [Niallia circulans]